MQFNDLLAEGSQLGIHVIASIDSFTIVMDGVDGSLYFAAENGSDEVEAEVIGNACANAAENCAVPIPDESPFTC